MKRNIVLILAFLSVCAVIMSCARVLPKNHYMLNYTPDHFERSAAEPYPKTVRLRPFDIEKVYARPNIVYRESPFKLDYYPDHLWAVRPSDMISDLIFRHMESIKLVNVLVRRIDEKGTPDYELSGTILAIEEYNSADLWYAHLRILVNLTDFRTGTVVYSRNFDMTRDVADKTPLAVVKGLSEIMDYIATALMIDLDRYFHNSANENDKELSE